MNLSKPGNAVILSGVLTDFDPNISLFNFPALTFVHADFFVGLHGLW